MKSFPGLNPFRPAHIKMEKEQSKRDHTEMEQEQSKRDRAKTLGKKRDTDKAGVMVEWGPPELGHPGPQFTGKMGLLL